MDPSRRRLLFASAGSSALAVLSACGGGGYSPPPPAAPPPPLAAGTCGATFITANHGHELTIPVADTNSTVSITYNIQGLADHNHQITLNPAQLTQIKAMGSLVMTSTVGSSSVYLMHTHDVTVNCA